MKKPQIAMNAKDFEARLEKLGPTDKLVPLSATETRAVWVRERGDGSRGRSIIILNFAATLDEMNAALARLAAKANPKPSVDLS